QNGGALAGNTECVSGAAAVITSYGAPYQNRMMRSDNESDGMQDVDNTCALCCSGGCYTAFGTNSCASGYAPAYTGRVGGIEAFNSAQVQGKTMCIDSAAVTSFTWATGYNTRLFRHRAPVGGGNPNGMDQVAGTCAVCCKL